MSLGFTTTRKVLEPRYHELSTGIYRDPIGCLRFRVQGFGITFKGPTTQIVGFQGPNTMKSIAFGPQRSLDP